MATGLNKMQNDGLEAVVYGRAKDYLIEGRYLKRFYYRIYCKYCKEQIEVRLVQGGDRAGQLPSSQEHNKRVYHDTACRNAYYSEVGIPKQKRQRPKKQHDALPVIGRIMGEKPKKITYIEKKLDAWDYFASPGLK